MFPVNYAVIFGVCWLGFKVCQTVNSDEDFCIKDLLYMFDTDHIHEKLRAGKASSAISGWNEMQP